MRHDELLAKIDALEIFDDWLEMTEAFRAVKILRAVVELHKPEKAYCLECSDIQYPCSTILAIEKELA